MALSDSVIKRQRKRRSGVKLLKSGESAYKIAHQAVAAKITKTIMKPERNSKDISEERMNRQRR
jgi:hypothetical protein